MKATTNMENIYANMSYTELIKVTGTQLSNIDSIIMDAAHNVARMFARGKDEKTVRTDLINTGADKTRVSVAIAIARDWDTTKDMDVNTAKAYGFAFGRDEKAARAALKSKEFKAAKTSKERAAIFSPIGKDSKPAKPAPADTRAVETRDAIRAVAEKIRNTRNAKDVDALLSLVDNLAALAGVTI